MATCRTISSGMRAHSSQPLVAGDPGVHALADFTEVSLDALATSPNVLYLVGMRKATTWGCAIVCFAGATLFGMVRASAQTQSAVAPTAAAPPAEVPPVVPPVAGPVEASTPAAASQPTPMAAPEPGQPPKPPPIDLHRDAPLPPPVMRTDHNHDGFYARLSLGFGSLGATMNPPQTNGIKGSGATLALDVALGYAVSPGIILGGTLMMESLPSVRLDADNPVVTDVSAGLLGPFFDGYPNARGGFHLGGGLGFAGTRVHPETAAGFTKANGFGLAGWLGYDIWVADQWSTGILVRLMGTRTKADAIATDNGAAGSASMATQSIALMLTGLYN
jgi:hypothetical protein